jgi:hypothetical protein
VNTTTIRLTAASADAARHVSLYHATSAMPATTAPGISALIVIVVIIIVMTALAKAARSLVALLGDLLRAAAAMTSILLTAALAIFLGIAILVH